MSAVAAPVLPGPTIPDEFPTEGLTPEQQEKAEKLKKKVDYPQHKFAGLYPASNPSDFAELKESIRRHGVEKTAFLARDPDGKDWGILEGNTRKRAVMELYDEGIFEAVNGKEIVLEFVKLDTTDPLDLLTFCVNTNVHRNLSPSQRAAIAVRVEGAETAILRAKGEKRKVVDPGTGTERNEKYEEKWERLHQQCRVNKMYVQNCLTLWHDRHYDLVDRIAEGALKIRDAVTISARRGKGMPDHPTEAEAKKGVKKVPGELLDDNEQKVPERLVPLFEANAEVEQTQKMLRKVKKLCTSIFAGAAGSDMQADVITDALDAAGRELRQGRMGVICPGCAGRARAKGSECKVCKGSGAASPRSIKEATEKGLLTP